MAISKLLVANRGEIALRVFRTARRLGIATVAVAPPDDAGALHARSADETVAVSSYLDAADLVRAAREAGATGVWANLLFLRPGTREHFLEHLAEDWPEQLPYYEELYAGRAYLGAAESKPVREEVRRLARDLDVRDRRPLKLAPPPEPEQLSLAF